MDHLQLSIIVPILNEREHLPSFFNDLSRQESIDFELIICDGGSSDGSLEWLEKQVSDWTTLKVVRGKAGRGRQLNQGIVAASGEWLLFLHVDSHFLDPLALRQGMDCLCRSGSKNVAGHFALKFCREISSFSAGYYFYEWKARLGRTETIHGDQGFYLHRFLLERIGSFREDLPAMEDTDFAERLRLTAQWKLLSAEISTSARRFETEGLWQRQLLGALIMCFRAIGWSQFFENAPAVYRQQQNSKKLFIQPFFQLIRKQLHQLPIRERWKIWWQAGCYIRNHAWQLFFAVDARRAFRKGLPIGTGKSTCINYFEPIFSFLTDNIFGQFCATILLRCWFELTDLWLKKKERS